MMFISYLLDSPSNSINICLYITLIIQRERERERGEGEKEGKGGQKGRKDIYIYIK